jgi:hypothetical protein
VLSSFLGLLVQGLADKRARRPKPAESLVKLYLADIEEDRAKALVCYAFPVPDENTATGWYNQPAKVVVLAGVVGDEWVAGDVRRVVYSSLQAGVRVETVGLHGAVRGDLVRERHFQSAPGLAYLAPRAARLRPRARACAVPGASQREGPRAQRVCHVPKQLRFQNSR